MVWDKFNKRKANIKVMRTALEPYVLDILKKKIN